MKKKLLFMQCLVLGIVLVCSVGAKAQTTTTPKVTLSGDPDSITPVIFTAGSSENVAYLYATDVAAFCGTELNLFLPEGVSIIKKANSTLTKDEEGENIHSVSYSDKGAEGWKLLIYSSELIKFNGNKGALAKLTFSVSSSFVGGIAKFKDGMFTDPKTIPDDSEVTIYEASNPSFGFIKFADANVKAICVANWDANGDGELSYDEAKAVTSLGEAFMYNSTITSFNELQYFTGLTEIANSTFWLCSSLISVTIPNSVTSIGNYAFRGCSSLTSITIPNSVTSIGTAAFFDCIGLTSVTIPNSVTSIGEYAFEYCSGLTSVTIPNSVTSIGEGAFVQCSGLTSITIPNSVTSIAFRTFNGCSSLISVTIPNSVTSIEHEAFRNCSGLTSVTIPNSVTSIGDAAFTVCSGLTSITIPNSVTSIGAGAFEGCSGLTSVTIPNSVTSIAFRTFDACSSLISVTIPNSVTSIGEYAFEYCIGLTSVTIPNSVTSIGDGAFAECTGLTSITIPNSVTSIGESAFYQCSGLTSITIPNSVTSIENYAFKECSGLTSVTIPNSVTSIGAGAFESCSGLTSVTIPNSVTSIGEGAFLQCHGLTSVTIPNSVTSIGEYAFMSCDSLKNVYVEWNIPLFVTTYTFSDTPISSATLHVPIGTKDKYATAEVWKDFGTIVDDVTSGNIEFADANVKAICVANWDTNSDGELSYDEAKAVTSLGEAFKGDSTITSFNELQNFTGLTSIGDDAFFGCSGLTSVTIPNSVTSIGSYAFYGCSGLTSVTIPNSVTSIGKRAFYGCSGLTSVTIPNSVTSIGDDAFYNCSGLTSVTIPNSVTSIGEWAFSRCSGLTSVIIPNSVTSIGHYAFCDCDNLKDVYVYWNFPLQIVYNVFENANLSAATLHVPVGTKALYKAAEVWKDFGTIDDGTQDYGGDPIEFADANVRAVCIANWDFNGDGEFTTGEAEHVYDLGDAFKGNTDIKSFLELKYFTGLEKITNENFAGCENLKVMACEKQNLEIEDQVMTHPNAMLYINGGVNSNFGGNTIWHGEAKEIVLTDGEELDIPVEFYAEQISYTRNFEKKTYPGVCAGWETIVLPFDVYSITHETKGQLAPIHSGLAGKSFWLGTLQDRGGFMNDVRIRANVPYLISMPNSDSYADQYNLNGKVTFSSEYVMVRRTNEVESIWGSAYALVPTYDFIDAPDIYTINDDTYMNYYPGGVFTKSLRSARPFEAFVVVEHGNAKGYIDLFGEDPSGIADIMPAINESHEVYDLNGRKVATDGKALSRMPHGVYIIDGKKIVK